MRNIFLIAQREYKERVRTRAFLITTLLLPFLMIGMVTVPTLLMLRVGGESRHIVVVAPDRTMGEAIRAELEKDQASAQEPASGKDKSNGKAIDKKDKFDLSDDEPSFGKVSVDIETDASDTNRAALMAQMREKKVDMVIWATSEALAAKKIELDTRVSGIGFNQIVQSRLNRVLRREMLKKKGLVDDEITAVLDPATFELKDATGNGTNPMLKYLGSLIPTFVLYISVIIYGATVLRAVVEEKTSRIMEVMLATVTPRELMAGKILGVGAVGLTQVAAWMLMSGLPAIGGGASMPVQLKNVLPLTTLLFFPVFYILGYALYSCMFAAVGAMVNSEQEAQQMQSWVMMPLIASAVLMGALIQSPNSSLAFWASMFPLTSPLLMFSRIATQSVPIWQICLSIALLIGGIYVMIWIAARIYRVGILMYGKKPTLPEIMKWIKYSY
ncbi:MAG TPA: ABC transporter permease [Candidatus Angelobacter sp.]|nr:ABC transporter permease [Candidatus Angelobacter sp.]